MIKKINSNLGIKLFIILAGVILLSVGPLSYMTLEAIKGYGEQAADINEQQIRANVFASLKEITKERADKYQLYFDRIASSAALLGKQASTIYSNIAYYAEKPLLDYHFSVLPQNGIWSNSINDPVVSMYWGTPELSSKIHDELKALTHMTPLYQQVLVNIPEVVASHSITVSGIGQYCTNNFENKTAVFNLPPVSDFDLRDGEPVTIFTRSSEPLREVRWTSIYKDDVVDGLMLTASAPAYDQNNVFRAIAGIDVPLSTIIEDILHYGSNNIDDVILFSFLVDKYGRLIAFPDDYLDLFGLEIEPSELVNSADKLDVFLSDSKKSEIKKLAEELLQTETLISDFGTTPDSYYVATSKLENLGWIFGVVAREETMLHSVHENRTALVGTVRRLGQRGIFLAGLTTFSALIIVFFALKYLVLPLRTLADATKRVASGDYSVRCQVSTSDEAGVLAESFNSMVEKLHAAQEQQVHYAHSLEREVKWKDAALNEKRSELEATIELLNKEVERRQIIAEALRNSQQQYYDTLEASVAGVYIIEDGIFTYVNNSLAEMMRATTGDLKGKDPLDFIIDDDRALVSENMKRRLNGIEIPPYTIRCRRTDGTIYYGEVWAKTATWQNKAVMVGTITDVTSLKRKDERLMLQDQQLQKSLEEKETLLREIYHRTKNNMLVIISMLDLQLQDIDDEKIKTIFLETEHRIRAMALVHEKLYQSQNLSEIDLGSYLQEIIESLIAHMVLDDSVLLQADTEPMAINIDYAVPLGLVINEIVTNSLKHAFADNKPGVIYLTLKKGLDGEIELMVGDNGIGLPEQLSIETTTSFGLQIISNLVVMQLNGEIAVDRNNGTQYLISFKESRKTKRI